MHKQSCISDVKRQLCCRSKARSRSVQVLKTARDFALPTSDLYRIIEEYYISLNSVVSLSCLILFRAGEFKQLVEKEIDPRSYLNVVDFRDDFAAVSFLRKCKFLETGIDTKEAALQAFRASEDACKVTNDRFNNLTFDPLFKGANVWLLNATSRKISQILGKFSIDRFLDMGSWGPGVTNLVKGSNVSASRKFREESGITSSTCALFGSLLPFAYPRWFDEAKLRALRIEPGNNVITVPKNAKTDRTIAIEPGINSWFQLAMGKSIRHRLARAGYNLNSDEANRRGAFIGSKSGRLATVDFSAASDTISYNVVREIVPQEWFSVLDSLRSPCYNLDGVHYYYRKFSAMGNGFTFELESLIFVTAAVACCDYLDLDSSQVSVFGDDIIIPVEAFELYRSFCSFLGFTVNPRKSFSDGMFRESCGSYFFNGVDVKPIFLKDNIKGVLHLFRLANAIRGLAERRNTFGCDASLYNVWSFIVRKIPHTLRIKGPKGFGDGVLHSNFDEALPRRARDQWCGFLHSGFLVETVSVSDDSPGLLQARLWRPSVERQFSNTVDLRSVTKMRFKTSIFSALWHNFGPWI